MPGKISVDFDTMQANMETVNNAIQNIHIIDKKYNQTENTDLPSYEKLIEQLEVLHKISTDSKTIMEIVSMNVMNAYQSLYDTDQNIKTTLE